MDEEACSISYIPERLHRNNRPIIDHFEVGECLYMRCKPDVVHNPYMGISITELSHNRQGLSTNYLSIPDDVMYNIDIEKNYEIIPDRVICILKIKSLNAENKYRKVFTQTKNEHQHECVIELLHDPECCMYPHAVFRVWLDNIRITYDNYEKTINKLKEIKQKLKYELASMIVRLEVDQNELAPGQ